MYKLDLQANPTNNSHFQNQETPLNPPVIDEAPIVRQNQPVMTQKSKRTFLIICTIAIVAGALTGFGAHKLQAKNGTGAEVTNVAVTDPNQIKNGDVFGVQDKDTFADSATGYIEAGGVEGEGSHKLLREGGASQTVALTSSVVDLEKLVGAQVKVYGETFKAEKAGWFMDVGRVEVIEVNGQAPLQTLD